MTTIIDMAVIVFACVAAYLAYAAAEHTLHHLNLGAPRAVSLAVAMLTFLAVLELGKGIIILLLIPYAALGLALLVLYFWSFYNARMPNAGARIARNAQRFLQWISRSRAGRTYRPNPSLGKIHSRLERERAKIRKFMEWR